MGSGVFAKAFIGGFFGKLAGTLFLAIVLGIGPDKWAKFIVTGLPIWATPERARAVFLAFAALTFIVLAWSPLKRFLIGRINKRSAQKDLPRPSVTGEDVLGRSREDDNKLVRRILGFKRDDDSR